MCEEPGEVLGDPACGPALLHRHGRRGPRHHRARQLGAGGRALGAAQAAAAHISVVVVNLASIYYLLLL